MGRHISVSPHNSAMRHLQYGRIILRGAKKAEAFSTEARETGLICLSGEGSVAVGGKEFALGTYDAIYIPRDSAVKVTTYSDVDFVEFSAEVQHSYPLQVVRFGELERNPGLKFSTGGPG